MCLKKESKKYFRKKIKTIYFGGGTPTLLSEEQLAVLINLIYKNFNIQKNCEFTIETNPDTIDLSKAKLLHSLGVNRISIGAQSFDNNYLKFLGRTHTSQDIEMCFDKMRLAGFSNINLDFMYGFPGQTKVQLAKDVKRFVSFRPEHISAYSLGIEKNSKFFRQKVKMPNSQTMGRLYSCVSDLCGKNNFEQYEVSNFSRPGYRSEHNKIYWMCDDYIGLGMGAHSHVKGKRFSNNTELYPYIQAIEKNISPIIFEEKLSKDQRLMEAFLFALRMNDGVRTIALEKRFGTKIALEKKQKIKQFIRDGFFVLDKGILKATDAGRLVLDELSVHLI